MGDIDTVRHNARLKRIAITVQLYAALQTLLPRFYMQRADHCTIEEYPNHNSHFCDWVCTVLVLYSYCVLFGLWTLFFYY